MLRLFADDSPNPIMIPVREDSEVAVIYPDAWSFKKK